MSPDEVDALIASKPLAQELAANPEVKALADGPGRPTGNGSNGIISRGGNNASYLVRRLKRDRLDIAEALARGEYKSARAAGIVRVPTKVDVVRRGQKGAAGLRRTRTPGGVLPPTDSSAFPEATAPERPCYVSGLWICLIWQEKEQPQRQEGCVAGAICSLSPARHSCLSAARCVGLKTKAVHSGTDHLHREHLAPIGFAPLGQLPGKRGLTPLRWSWLASRPKMKDPIPTLGVNRATQGTA